MPLIDYEQAARIAKALSGIRIEPDPFTDPNYYPPPSESRERVAMYFLVMVAMDHRLSRPGKPYEASIDGKRFHGADLLYRLGMKKYLEDPDFFTPERLAETTREDILRWLCVGNVCPPDPERRAHLLRDLGVKLLKLYGGSALAIIEKAGGRLYGSPEAPGLVDLLKVFTAYNDPVDKKALLLAKFLERRGIFRVGNMWEKRVPVDNHVTRIALRLGLVVLEEPLQRKLLEGSEFTPWEDVAVRITVREAWWIVARMANIDPFLLDDLLWTMGRKICIHDAPKCEKCSGHPVCVEGICALSHICPAGLGLRKPVEEHKFLNTWWY